MASATVEELPQGLSDLSGPLPRQVGFRTTLRYLSLPAVRIIATLAAVNVLVWIAVAIVLRWHPLLSSTALLSYTFGLRHALDADHISVIDLMTRRLIASGSRPVTVGMWFSLGHSTIVIVTCIVVAATSGALEKRFDGFERVGNIVGTAVSAGVLILLGIGNAWILLKLVQKLRELLDKDVDEDARTFRADGGFNLEGGGLLVRLLKKVFKVIDRPWKMYFVGVMFGLGFDTSSEIAVIGIASVQGAEGTSIWLILIFPVLFTGKRTPPPYLQALITNFVVAGMCLIDTTDGALMMTLYTSTSFARDTVAILYYSIVLTAITVIVAICIGTIQLLSLVTGVASPSGKFWDGVNNAGDRFDIIGGAICGSFVLFGIASVLLYRPWRRRVDRKRRRAPVEGDQLQDIGVKTTNDSKQIGMIEDTNEIRPAN
jgi:nickel/cobalt transporter (NiCoT) family protein